MITLTQRQKNIIRYLLKSEDFVNTKAIADNFEVSERTIRYDLDVVEQYLKTMDSILVRKPRLGVKIEDNSTFKSNLNDILQDFNNRIFSKDERVYLISIYLLIEGVSLTLEKLSNLLYVSKNTIISDLNDVEHLILNHSLCIGKNHSGFFIVGEEEFIRNGFYSLYMYGVKKSIINKNIIQELIGLGINEEIFRIITQMEKEMNIHYSDTSKEELQISLLFTLKRAFLGKNINYSEEIISKYTIKKEFKALKEITDGKQDKLKLTTSDLCYLTKMFLGAKIMFYMESSEISSEDKEANILAKKIIQDSEEYIGIDFSNDYEFINSLAIHLKVALYRLRNNLIIENPLTEQIKYRITFIYEITKKILANYEEEIECSFPEDEIAYIAMYIGAAFEKNLQSGFMPTVLVICGSGMATSGILSTRLKIMVPELKIIGPIAIQDMTAKLKEYKIDFIITTVDVKEDRFEVIKVNPLLDVNDIDNIKNLIFKNTYKKQSEYLAKRYEVAKKDKLLFKDIIPEENTEFNVEEKAWRQAIKIASKSLIKKKIIENSYVLAMIKAVEELGPYMVFIPGIAFAHASPESGVKGEGISLITLKEDILFGDNHKEKVKMIVVLATDKNKSNILTQLISILEKDDNINILKNTSEYRAINELSN